MLWEEPTRKPVPMKVKRQVYRRAKGKCEKCGIKLKKNEGDFHHIRDSTVTPRPASVRFLCPLCHRRYGHKRSVRRVDAGTFWETKKVKTVPREVVKVGRKKPKARRKRRRRKLKSTRRKTRRKSIGKKRKPKTKRKKR